MFKGYYTRIEYDAQDMILHGKIEGIGDLVDFEAENAHEIEKEFHAAVDDYLTFCAENGKEPDKEYKGSFNVRISPQLHKKMAQKAMHDGLTLNQAVGLACMAYCEEKKEQPVLQA